MNRLTRLAVSGAVATSATRTARSLLDSAFGVSAWWRRTNHAGGTVSLLEGPAVVAGLAAGAVAGASDVRSALSAATAVCGAGSLGMVDDLFEDSDEPRRGLRGHLMALGQGRVTTGTVKIIGIGVTSLLSAAMLPRSDASVVDRPSPGTSRPSARALELVVDAALVAGTANLVNLCDLRPGRALKAAAVLAAPLAGSHASGTSGAVLGAAVAAAPADLDARDMLGDTGANALGAAVGHAVAVGATLPAKVGVLATVAGLTLLSERVSFSAVIDRSRWLRAADSWGRQDRGETMRDD